MHAGVVGAVETDALGAADDVLPELSSVSGRGRCGDESEGGYRGHCGDQDSLHDGLETSGLNAPVTDPELAQQLGEIIVGCVDERTFISVALLGAYAPGSTEVSCIVDKLSPDQYLELTVSGLMRDASGAGPFQAAAADCLPI